MLDGVLPIYKEKGIASFDVIRQLKKILKGYLKGEKIGHGGTLDPFAEGVLLILFGNATRCFQFLLDSSKEYLATIRFGAFTDTDDVTGRIIEETDLIPSIFDIEKKLNEFKGKITQLPPAFSAIKIDGKRSYEIARKGGEIKKLKPREVEIHEIKIEEYDEKEGLLKVFISCSSGTYIRSIARDLGKMLGCGAFLEELLRKKSGNVDVSMCYKVEEITPQNIASKLVDVEDLIDYPSIEWVGDEDFIKNGRWIKRNMISGEIAPLGRYKLVKHGRLLAVVEAHKDGFKYLRVFL